MKNQQLVAAAILAAGIGLTSMVELVRIQGVGGLGLTVLIFVGFLGVAVGAARWSPALGLGAAWGAGLVQLLGGVPVLLTQAALLFVLFAAARWGRWPTVLLAAASVGLVPMLALAWVRVVGIDAGIGSALLFDLLGAANATVRDWRLLLLGFAVLGIPVLAGLALRFFAGERTAQTARDTAEREARQAQEIARLQEAQNRLARDVHDVVGHSLTVILAQAESAQYIDDPAKLKQTMQTIATSARTSLQDVRQVLTPGLETRAARRGGLDALIEAVRDSGQPIVATEVGDPRPLPPELDAVAYRVLQEMLTNAIKHGRRDRAVLVERRWPRPDASSAVLRILVRNIVDGSRAPGENAGGQGLDGMRRRLESVGGTLTVQRVDEPDGAAFVAEASVPVRTPLAGGAA